MRDIAIFGAGGFGKEVACLIRRINEGEGDWNLVGFFDDTKDVGTSISHYGVILGGIDAVNKWKTPLSLVIAVGNPDSIFKIKCHINNCNIHFPNLIDPNFQIVDPETFLIGQGNIIQGNCSVSCDVKIGDFNVLNGSVVIGHDVVVGNYNVIMPDIRISGNVHIGEQNMLGVGSIIIQNTKIGNNIHLGAGAVLMTRPKDNSTYIGNPAKIFKYNL